MRGLNVRLLIKIILAIIIVAIGILPFLAYFETDRAEVSSAVFDPARAQDLQTVLDESVRELNIPGTVAMVRSPDGAVWAGAAGVSRVSNLNRQGDAGWQGSPMTTDVYFRIGSVTKTFTATLILLLAEDGRLTLGDTVEDWLPGILPQGRTITVRHLLNMTSGLNNYTNDDSFADDLLGDPLRKRTPEELIRVAVGQGSAFEPGAEGGWLYSNTGYILLQLIAERATGRSYDRLLADRIVRPLGLTHTFVPQGPTLPSPSAGGYLNIEAQWRDMTEQDPSIYGAAGALVSTASDLLVWARALSEGVLLDEPSRKEMFQFVDVGLPDAAYGLGVGRFGPGFLGHTGTVLGYDTAMYSCKGYDFVVLVNTALEDESPSVRIMKKAAALFFPVEEADRKPAKTS